MSSSVSKTAEMAAARYADHLIRNRDERVFNRVHNPKFAAAEKASRKRYVKRQKALNKLARQFVTEFREEYDAWLQVGAAPI
jgi:hypothetical protein